MIIANIKSFGMGLYISCPDSAIKMGHRLDQQKEMVAFVSQKLDSTGEFSVIEPGYRFGDDPLDKLKVRHIFLRNKDGVEMLVVNNSDYLSSYDLNAKLKRASERGIYTCFVLYKGSVHRDVPANEQDKFFNRQSAHGQFRYSTRHVGNVDGNAMIRCTNLERAVMAMYNGHVIYYQPQTGRLSQSLRVFKAHDVELKYYGRNEFAQDRVADTLKIMEGVATWLDFTFVPRDDVPEHKLSSIAYRITGSHFPVKIASPRKR
jgi:hypothetical protein